MGPFNGIIPTKKEMKNTTKCGVDEDRITDSSPVQNSNPLIADRFKMLTYLRVCPAFEPPRALP
jgi:hypothetical protein